MPGYTAKNRTVKYNCTYCTCYLHTSCNVVYDKACVVSYLTKYTDTKIGTPTVAQDVAYVLSDAYICAYYYNRLTVFTEKYIVCI